MFCYQCEETSMGKGCTMAGVCGKEGNVADLQDKLVYLVKRIARDGPKTEETDKLIMDSLFATITNANFDPSHFNERIRKAKELVDVSDEEIKQKAGVIKGDDEDARSLRELATYGIKGMCAYLHHAYALGYKDQEIFDFIRSTLARLLEEDNPEKLQKIVLEVGETGVRTMALLDKANTESFGKPEPTQVPLGVGDRPGIIVSGHDLRDLKELLDQTEGKGVDVYTHGEMLPAQSYPSFKGYSHFKGNYGGSWWQQGKEFERFNGAILMTTNCLIPPKDAYKERLYTTGVVGFLGIKHIPDRVYDEPKDFSAVIGCAKGCKAPEQIEDKAIVGGYAHDTVLSEADRIISAVKDGRIKRFIVMAGCDGRLANRRYYTDFASKLPKDTVILTAGCAKFRYNKLELGNIDGIPRVIDCGQCNDSYSIVVIAKKLAEAMGVDDINKLPVSYNIAWYEQKAVLVLLALLASGIRNIHLGPRLPAFISPGVLKVLVEKFSISGITSVEDDLKLIAPD